MLDFKYKVYHLGLDDEYEKEPVPTATFLWKSDADAFATIQNLRFTRIKHIVIKDD